MAPRPTRASSPCRGGCYSKRVKITERERHHFREIARVKERERRERLREALAEPAMKRIIEGLELGDAMPVSPEREALLDARALAQAELQSRARRLGLR